MGIGDGSRKWAEVRQLVGGKDILHMEATEPKVRVQEHLWEILEAVSTSILPK